MRRLNPIYWLPKGVWVLTVLIMGLLISCSNPSGTQGADNTQVSAYEKGLETVPGAEAPISPTQLPQLQGEAIIVLQVQGQPITIAVNGTDAPVTAGNFVDLVDRGIYDGTTFHRVVRQPEPFVVQGGDPQSQDPNIPTNRLGTGGFVDPDTERPRYVPLEILPEGADQPTYGKTLKSAGVTQPPKLKHARGAVAMARSPLPDSASSQFYIALSDLPMLDGDYAVFGLVTDGMETVDQIQQGDRIDSAKVLKGLENLNQ